MKIKTGFQPPIGTYPVEIDELKIILKQNIRSANTTYFSPPNLKKNEIKALHEFKQNNELVIKKADKGSAVVLLQRDDYVEEGLRQLRSTIHYKSITGPIFIDHCEKFNIILKEMLDRKFITFKEFKFLTCDPQSRPRQFYLLPKIHKPKSKWTGHTPPGRPIVSDSGSESYNISKFIDLYLSKFSTKHKSYVRNTYHFLDLIRHLKIPQDSYLISLDVDSLYTNIENDLGLTAMEAAFSAEPSPIQPYIIKLTKMCLESNDFLFDDRFYLQISGTAMGRTFAPHYADIAMAHWETEALKKCTKLPLLYLRFLDDICIIWPHSREEFTTFFNTLNNHHPRIKLKSDIQTNSLEFLDVTIFKGQRFRSEGILDTKVFFKETDSHALLHKTSFHPQHLFRGIVRSQLIRFARICNNLQDFEVACGTLFQVLRHRGYTDRLLRSEKYRVKTLWYDQKLTLDEIECPLRACSVCTNRSHNRWVETKNGPWPLDSSLGCDTKNCVVLISCLHCNDAGLIDFLPTLGVLYSTPNSLPVTLSLNPSLVKHYSDHAPNSWKWAILESCRSIEDGASAKAKWILKLDTINKGLNIIKDLGNNHPSVFAIQYGPWGKELGKLVRDWAKNFSTNLPGTTKKTPLNLIQANTRNKTLKDHLVQAKLKPRDDESQRHQENLNTPNK